MRIVIFASLFASVIYAQSSMTYLNLMWPAEPTLTLISSDATATTYEKNCLSDDTRVTTDLFRPWCKMSQLDSLSKLMLTLPTSLRRYV
jgi:hypothetical protein